MNALLAPRPGRDRIPAGFIAVALLFYFVDGLIARSSAFLERPDVLGPAVSIDLTFGVTAAWWLLVVRRRGAPLRSLLPVFVVSIVAAMLTLPPGHRDLLPYFRLLAIPFELAVMAGVAVAVRRANATLAAAGTSLDWPERIAAALADAMPARVAGIVATETAMFAYALWSWRRKPFAPASTSAFSYHRRNGYAAILYTVAGLAAVELVAVDLLVRARFPHAANLLLVADAFAFVWLIGFARAVQLRPILVTNDALLVRSGLRWSIDIPRSNIASIELRRVTTPAQRPAGWIQTAPQPNVLVTLHTSTIARGPYGTQRAVTHIALAVDDAKKFERALHD